MRRAAGLLWIAAMLAPTAMAWAQEADCRNPQTQTDMNVCADHDYKQTDAELNRLYRALRGRMKGDAATLEDAERAWLAYRDKECDFETSPEAGGSIRPTLQAMCLKAKTERRNAELRQLLKCWDDATTCSY